MTFAKWNSWFLFLSLCVGLSGCLQTRGDISEEEEKQKIQSTVSTLQRSKADYDARLDGIDSELRQLNGKIETLSHQHEQSSEQKKNESALQSKKTDDILAQMKIFDETLLRAHQRIDQLEKELAQKGASGAGGDGKREKASDVFKQAEELFAAKDWKRAASTYQKYREQAPKGKELAQATYKIGICFQELGMKAEAKSFFEEVIEKFPKDNAAKSASFRLKQLKK